jgi:hypothetical protein
LNQDNVKSFSTVVANYRTGSSTLTQSLGGGLGTEYFHPGSNPYIANNNQVHNRTNQSVYKVMPDHWGYEYYYDAFKNEYLHKADKIYFTVRKDFDAQVTSLLYAYCTADWHPFSKNILRLEITNDVLYNNVKKYIVLLKKNLEWQSKCYKELKECNTCCKIHDIDICWLEDRFDKSLKYKRRVEVDLPTIALGINPVDYF